MVLGNSISRYVVTIFFKLKYLFLLSLHLVDNLVKNVDELGSEHHVRTHINEPPCCLQNQLSLMSKNFPSSIFCYAKKYTKFLGHSNASCWFLAKITKPCFFVVLELQYLLIMYINQVLLAKFRSETR